ncbi:MAG: hypothetical protein K0S23_1827 [Fluviicola sp.]|jgi:hypothetical protein|uniref:DUF3857 domain-containing protein n=1 Tax=Fluviicola sp. TaxID=1917219 RepID=UPI00260E0CAC|nr:DUF3857 domain-containing protein [Fluviicola sp.]MDF3027520.1 hypothetical protein [Fluviicola sp.]
MKLLLLITLLFCSAGNYTFAGDKYNWPTFSAVTIPDSVKNEEAIYLENRLTIDFMPDYEMSYVNFKRIKILSKKGVESYINHDLYQFNGGIIKLMKARIIKTDGTIIELGSENIKETAIDSKSKYESSYIKRIQFIFPTLEVNDVIDVVYQIDYKSYDLSDCRYLESDLISLNSKLALRNFSKYDLTVFPSKSLSNYKLTQEGGSPVFSWEVKSVPKIAESTFQAYPENAQKVVYNLWMPGERLDYEVIYSGDYDRYHVRNGFKSFSEELSAAGITKTDLSLLENINRITQYFEKETTWNTDANIPASVKPSDFYYRHLIDYTNYFRLIQLYLEENKTPYHVGFTNDISDGVFEHGYVALHQLEYRFLLIEIAPGNEHFQFAPAGKNAFYYMDEVPAWCEGNQAIIFTGDRDKLALSKAVIPQSDWTNNKHTANIIIKTSKLNEQKHLLNRRDSFSGLYSILFRNPKDARTFKRLNVSDTIVKPAEVKDIYPYTLSIKQDDTLENLFSEFDTKLYAFNAKELIPNYVYFEDETKEKPGTYSILPYSKHQKYAIYIEAQDSIKLADNITSISKENSVGIVKCDIIQTNPKTIKINYEIKLTKRLLATPSENQEYSDLLKEWANIVIKKWIIREE